MKVTFDLPRVLHLLVLVFFTLVGGSFLVNQYNWSGLSAYGLVCTIVCQISSAILKVRDGRLGEIGEIMSAVPEEKKKTRAERGSGGNPKKKQRRKEQ